MTKSHRGKAGKKTTRKKQQKSVARVVPDQSASLANSSKPKRPGAFVPGDPRINRTKPGPGRPRGKFARKCRRVLNGTKTWRAVRRTLHNEKNPAFSAMWKEVTNRGYGRQASSGLNIGLGGEGGEEGPEGQTQISAIVLLTNKLDQMASRKDKAKEHLKEAS